MKIIGAIGAGATLVSTADPYNYDIVLPRGYRGVLFRLNIGTAPTGTTPVLDIKVQYYDELRQTYEDLTDWTIANSVAFAQKSAAGEDDIVLYPSGAAGVANRRFNVTPPKKLRIVATLGADADESFTNVTLVGIPLE